jgi:outer membrane protein OmpA-like peptidoglycan-associated protein
LNVHNFRRFPWGVSRKRALCATVALVTASVSFLFAVTTTNAASSAAISRTSTTTSKLVPKIGTTGYPVGTPDSSEPSGDSPPGPSALSSYSESYVNDFAGGSLPSGWTTFSGQPSSDPGALFSGSDVAVGNGVLSLNATQGKGGWSTGGVCQCNVDQTYGAYFVRSRLTGAGPTQVELLWPTGNWPPEIDFDETFGDTDLATATLHYSSSDSQVHQTTSIDMTQWHTWGVIWTANEIIYTVDGSVWGQVTDSSEIPDQPMTLDIQQQTWCASDWACPTSDQSTYVDWVAEYTSGGSSPSTTTTTAPPASGSGSGGSGGSTPTTTTTAPIKTAPPVSNASRQQVVVGPFKSNSASLSHRIKTQIASLARKIRRLKDLHVKLVGYSDSPKESARDRAIARARAAAVEKFLRARLKDIKVRGAKIAAIGSTSPRDRDRVVVSIS